MDELDLIRSFRSHVPSPTEAARERADAAWRSRRSRFRWAPPRVRARAVPVVAPLVLAVATALALVGLGRHGATGPADARAAETLRRAAAADDTGLPRPLRAGEFWYVRTRSASIVGGDEDRYTVIQPQVREDWVAADGTRRSVIRRDGPMRFPGERDRRRWEAAGRPPAYGNADYHFGPPRRGPFYLGDARLSYAEVLALPRQAARLYDRLRDAAIACGCGNSVDQETFVIVTDMLRDVPMPTDLRGSVLRAAALIPGIRMVDRERDLAGREGVAVAFDSAGHRDALVFDRSTYELLGENDRQLRRDDYTDADPGQLVGGRAYVESGIVRSTTERPGGSR
jgi:hypothetical protein